jgi:hypothetical protein
MVMLAGVLFFGPETPGGRLISTLAPSASVISSVALPSAVAQIVAIGVATYVILLPLAYAGMVYNFYVRRRLAPPWQSILERYTNLFGIILWRVFSADLVNFTVEIHAEPEGGVMRVLVSDYRNALFHRFSHVCEMIAITSVFTTLKYYPGDSALFQERLMRYARTLPGSSTDLLVFVYKAIRKSETAFTQSTVAEFVVDSGTATVTERVVDPHSSVRAVSEYSPVHEGARPGSYAPPA